MSYDSQKITWPGWETGSLIGQGSFGAVYEIQRDMFGDIEKAALKVISIPQNRSDIDELYSDGYDEESITHTFHEHLQSIVAEYSLMRKMNGSANVVNCDDIRYVQHEDGIGWDIFIKMELLTPLTKVLPEEIPEALAVKIAKDMCSALELCKKYDIVHRDIKPQNIFVSPNGDFKLGDFGIAKTVEKTTGGTKIGTYKYMAPEVYHSQPYGSAADIYSLGLVLYWLLNERRMPFLPLPPEKLNPGMDDEARNRRLAGEPIPAPEHGSHELKQIVLKACAYDVKERYTSATEMLKDLNELGYADEVSDDEDAVSDIILEEAEDKTVIFTKAVEENVIEDKETKATEEMIAPVDEEPQTTKSDEEEEKNAVINHSKKSGKKLIGWIIGILLVAMIGAGAWIIHINQVAELVISSGNCYEGAFDAKSVGLYAVYKNGKKEEITTGFTCQPEVLEPGAQEVTISYKGIQNVFNLNVWRIDKLTTEIKNLSGNQYNQNGKVNWVLYISMTYSGEYATSNFENELRFNSSSDLEWSTYWKRAKKSNGANWYINTEEVGDNQYYAGMVIVLPDNPYFAGNHTATIRIGDFLTKTIDYTLVYKGDYENGTGWEITNVSWK